MCYIIITKREKGIEKMRKSHSLLHTIITIFVIIVFILAIGLSLFGEVVKLNLLSSIWNDIPAWLKFVIIFK